MKLRGIPRGFESSKSAEDLIELINTAVANAEVYAPDPPKIKHMPPNLGPTVEMLKTGDNIPENNQDDDVYYNRSSSTNNTQSLRDFHNIVVKLTRLKQDDSEVNHTPHSGEHNKTKINGLSEENESINGSDHYHDKNQEEVEGLIVH